MMIATRLSPDLNTLERLPVLAEFLGLSISELEAMANKNGYLIIHNHIIKKNQWAWVSADIFHNYYQFVSPETNEFAEIELRPITATED